MKNKGFTMKEYELATGYTLEELKSMQMKTGKKPSILDGFSVEDIQGGIKNYDEPFYLHRRATMIIGNYINQAYKKLYIHFMDKLLKKYQDMYINQQEVSVDMMLHDMKNQ
ncbi:hypothetical protein [Solobacterium moorei]|uniref:hypothetical protein n=1 Tax=Solobacterium moorei TaxID=102148 RepID=UPI0012DF8725|nr:hypothetical protein [Solobacterium moorei]